MPGVKGRSGGHNKKSIADLQAAGTFRPDRHGGLEDPVAPVGHPEPPKTLKGDARAEWDRLLSLVDPRVLTKEKYQVVYQVAKAFAEMERLETKRAAIEQRIAKLDQQIKTMGDQVESFDLLIQANQIVAKLEALSKALTTEIRGQRNTMRTYLVELGLTPASAARVKLPKSDPEKKPSRLLTFIAGGKQEAAKA